MTTEEGPLGPEFAGAQEERLFWPDHPVFGSNAGQHSTGFLYHYTSVEKAAAIALTGQLLLSPLGVVNDPREASRYNPSFSVSFGGFGSDDEKNRRRQRRSVALSDYQDSVRIACFSMDDPAIPSDDIHGEWMHGYANMSLWAHYANANQGVCLIFDRAELEATASSRFDAHSLHIEDVQYVEGADDAYQRSRVLTDTEDETDDLPRARQALFRKSHHWKSEAERRLLVEGWGHGQCSLPIGECLKGFVVGLKFPVHHLAIAKAIYTQLGIADDYVAQLEMGNDGSIKTVPMISPDGAFVMYGPAVSVSEWHSSIVFRRS